MNEIPRSKMRSRFLNYIREAVACAAIVVMIGPVRAQTNRSFDSDSSLRFAMQQESSNIDSLPPTLEERLQELKNATERLRQKRSPIPVDKESSNVKQNLSQLFESDSESENEAEDELSKIQNRIRVLQRLRRNAKTSVPVGDRIKADRIPLRVDTKPIENNTPIDSPPIPEIDQSLSATGQESRSDMASEANEKVLPPNVDAERLLPGPVNTLALGENLYRTHHYDAALRALSQVDTEGMSQSNRMWLDLLTALCKQKTDDFETAVGTLRDIANENSQDYPVQAAKWYLKFTESKQQQNQKLEELSAAIELIIRRVEEDAGKQ